MLLRLNGNKSRQPGSKILWKAFPEEWRLLQQKINVQQSSKGCNVRVSTDFWPFSVCSAMFQD